VIARFSRHEMAIALASLATFVTWRRRSETQIPETGSVRCDGDHAGLVHAGEAKRARRDEREIWPVQLL